VAWAEQTSAFLQQKSLSEENARFETDYLLQTILTQTRIPHVEANFQFVHGS